MRSGPYIPPQQRCALADARGDWLSEVVERLGRIEDLLAARKKPKLTVEEVAQLTGRSGYTVRRWIKMKLLAADRVAGAGPKGRLIIDRGELDKLMKSGKAAATPGIAMSGPPAGEAHPEGEGRP